MHILRFRSASGKLREFVRAYAQRDLDAGDQPVTEVCPARLEQELEFQFRSPFEVVQADGGRFETPPVTIIGTYTRKACHITFRRRVETFAVFFQPAGFSRLFGIPIRELSNTAYDASSVVGTQIRRLWSQLAECPSFERRVQITETLFLQRAIRSDHRSQLSLAADSILARRGAVRIADLAHDHGLGLRQFERKFLNETGVAPKLYARVARFQTALDMKVAFPQRSWLEIAHDVQYHDQMHMIRDFHDLAGDAPGQIFQGIGDLRPPAHLSDRRDEDFGQVVLR